MTATQPAKQDRPVDSVMIHVARRQHAQAADKLAARIGNCAGAVHLALVNGQPAMPAARQMWSDFLELFGELARLSEVERFEGWTRQPAPKSGRAAA